MQNPVRAKNWQSIRDALDDRNGNKLAFAKAGGAAHSDEDESDQLHKILPPGCSHDMLSHAHDQPTAGKLVEWMKEKAVFIAEYGGGREGGAHLADAAASAEACHHLQTSQLGRGTVAIGKKTTKKRRRPRRNRLRP